MMRTGSLLLLLSLVALALAGCVTTSVALAYTGKDGQSISGGLTFTPK